MGLKEHEENKIFCGANKNINHTECSAVHISLPKKEL
jgi:hypothetical protein